MTARAGAKNSKRPLGEMKHFGRRPTNWQKEEESVRWCSAIYDDQVERGVIVI
jgi:hypothetical protein